MYCLKTFKQSLIVNTFSVYLYNDFLSLRGGTIYIIAIKYN